MPDRSTRDIEIQSNQDHSSSNQEAVRLQEDDERKKNWKRWGPYLSERQWATVREDYSPYGDCWSYFPHDHARSRAYRWGEDGLLGICDRECRLCFALALWNGKDPILKERLFGLTGQEGNHGEDVKEEYFYIDSTPTHSYMKALYKYPQAEFPYARLVEENRRRSRNDPEFELVDTGVFDENRYWDVQAEYAKAAPDDLLIRITAFNRGPRTPSCTCCRRSGTVTPGRGAARTKGARSSRTSARPRTMKMRWWRTIRRWAGSGLKLNRGPGRTRALALYRQRNELRAAV